MSSLSFITFADRNEVVDKRKLQVERRRQRARRRGRIRGDEQQPSGRRSHLRRDQPPELPGFLLANTQSNPKP